MVCFYCLFLLFVCFAVVSSEYNRIIIFKEPIKGKALQGHVIRSVKVANEGSCRVQCFMEPNCVSINVGPVQEGKGICELNNATDDSPSQSALKNVAQYIHYADYSLVTYMKVACVKVKSVQHSHLLSCSLDLIFPELMSASWRSLSRERCNVSGRIYQQGIPVCLPGRIQI